MFFFISFVTTLKLNRNGWIWFALWEWNFGTKKINVSFELFVVTSNLWLFTYTNKAVSKCVKLNLNTVTELFISCFKPLLLRVVLFWKSSLCPDMFKVTLEVSVKQIIKEIIKYHYNWTSVDCFVNVNKSLYVCRWSWWGSELVLIWNNVNDLVTRVIRSHQHVT